MKLFFLLGLCILFMLGTGCSSTQATRCSYQLVPLAEGNGHGIGKLEVTSVTLPEVVNRLELIREASPYQVKISEYGRWGGRLSRMMEEILNENLCRLAPLPLQAAAVGTAPRKISLQFVVFSLNEQNEFSAEVICREKGMVMKRISLKKKYELAGKADQAQAEATSQILKEIANTLVASLTEGK